MTNTQAITEQYPWVHLCNHVIEVTTWKGHDAHGLPVLDPTTTRRYRCLIQDNETTSWSDIGGTDGMPYLAYILSIPITGLVIDDIVPIRKNEQITVIAPSYLASEKPRRVGTVKSYFDQYGNLHNIAITFE